MKKLTISLFVLVAFYSPLLAQNYSYGIYLSATDFKNHKLSYAQIKDQKYKLQLYETFYKPIVKIIIGDSTYVLIKDSIFGYRDNLNGVYRFYQKHIYKVLNPNETILLYSRTSLGGYKNIETVVTYYFSFNSVILPLTIQNLKSEFLNYPIFYEMLDMYFHNESDLMAYDNFYKIYKLNRVFQFSNQFELKSK